MRVFGFYFTDNILKIDDADYKSSIIVNHIPWEFPLNKLIDLFNKTLKGICAFPKQDDLIITQP